MKTIYKVFACASAALALASCSDFLKESSQDQIRPKNASDYKELIAGEIYYKMNEYSPQNAWLDAMTDDCEELAKKASTFAPDKRIAAFGYYTWQQEPERQREGVLNSDGAWGLYYHQIFTCNMILNDVDDMEGTLEEKAQVKAEAYMIRAYAYYMLVNLYGEPYDPKTADKAAGVPVNGLIGVENKKFKRESVAAIYDQILTNGENALKQFEICGDGNSVFRWNKAAAEVFLSRVCLYMQNWEDAAKYANAALSIKADIWDLNQKAVDDASIDSYSYMDRFFTSRNPEILFTFGYSTEIFSAEGAGSCYPPSAELLAMYIDGDLRGDDGRRADVLLRRVADLIGSESVHDLAGRPFSTELPQFLAELLQFLSLRLRHPAQFPGKSLFQNLILQKQVLCSSYKIISIFLSDGLSLFGYDFSNPLHHQFQPLFHLFVYILKQLLITHKFLCPSLLHIVFSILVLQAHMFQSSRPQKKATVQSPASEKAEKSPPP